MAFGSRTTLGAALLALFLFACTVEAHGWMSSPSPRGQFKTPKRRNDQEWAPTQGGANAQMDQDLVCRGDPVMPRDKWIPLTAGVAQSITLEFNAPHPGDCFVYLTYDGDQPENQMQWFKIWEQHECYKNTHYDVPIPNYLPSGSHVIFRWEWYALHAFPTVEFYAQCVDAVMTGPTSGSLPTPQVSIPGHLPFMSGDYAQGTNNYWWPFDNQPMFFTGPRVATQGGQPAVNPTTRPSVAPTTRPTDPAVAPTTPSTPTTAPTNPPNPATQAPSTPSTPSPNTPSPSTPYPNNPSTPAPSEPSPSTPYPSNPSTPAPSEPSPSTPTPSEPSPSTPAPSEPSPSTPAPSGSTPGPSKGPTDGKCHIGAEGCSCTDGGACDAGLACDASHFCVYDSKLEDSNSASSVSFCILAVAAMAVIAL